MTAKSKWNVYIILAKYAKWVLYVEKPIDGRLGEEYS